MLLQTTIEQDFQTWVLTPKGRQIVQLALRDPTTSEYPFNIKREDIFTKIKTAEESLQQIIENSSKPLMDKDLKDIPIGQMILSV